MAQGLRRLVLIPGLSRHGIVNRPLHGVRQIRLMITGRAIVDFMYYGSY